MSADPRSTRDVLLFRDMVQRLTRALHGRPIQSNDDMWCASCCVDSYAEPRHEPNCKLARLLADAEKMVPESCGGAAVASVVKQTVQCPSCCVIGTALSTTAASGDRCMVGPDNWVLIDHSPSDMREAFACSQDCAELCEGKDPTV